MMKNNYWLRVNDENKGPYDFDELIEMKAQDTDYVWTKGMDSWTQLGTINDFQILKSQKVTGASTLWLKYFVLAFVGLFCLSFIYNFIQLPLYKREFGGKDGLDVLGEVAFDDTPLSMKAPAISFYILFLLVLITTILYSIVKSKWDTRRPIWLASLLIIAIPLILIIYRPTEKQYNRLSQEENIPEANEFETEIDLNTVSENIAATEAIKKDKSSPAEKDIKVTNKSMYATIIYSVQNSETGEYQSNFHPVFMIDSEISYEEEEQIVKKKIASIQSENLLQIITFKNLKAFESKSAAQKYIENFSDRTFFRPVTAHTFDTIASYVMERSMRRASENLGY
ncbi:hypothetical protein CBW16_10095 [Flavobacteriaceae bacterium JJC]|nr:hypothetical protein CBW16_10095 [Flavobacteriaceae bacterium JJC]